MMNGRTWQEAGFYLANTAEAHVRRVRLQEAIGFHELCIYMMEQHFVKDVEKEKAVTYIRKLGALYKLCSSFSEEVANNQIEIVVCAEAATNWTLNFALQDNQEQENLKDNLSKFIKLFDENRVDTSRLKKNYERVCSMEQGI